VGVVRRVFVGDLVAARLDSRSIAVGGTLQTVSMRVTVEQLRAESSLKILGTE
jgi:hypothetical protein